MERNDKSEAELLNRVLDGFDKALRVLKDDTYRHVASCTAVPQRTPRAHLTAEETNISTTALDRWKLSELASLSSNYLGSGPQYIRIEEYVYKIP